MWVKRNEDNETVSIFMGCTPSDKEEYTEVPDDAEVFEKFREEKENNRSNGATQEERITALEQALTAIEEGIASV